MKQGQNKQQSVSEAVNAFNWKRALILVLSTAFAMGLYFFLMNIYSLWKIVVIAYVAVASVLIVAYFIINRAFTGSGVTYEMLTDGM